MTCCFTIAKEQKDIPVEGHLLANPCCAGMVQGMMRNMMNDLMKVTKYDNDGTQQQVADFMVPSSVGKAFVHGGH